MCRIPRAPGIEFTCLALSWPKKRGSLSWSTGKLLGPWKRRERQREKGEGSSSIVVDPAPTETRRPRRPMFTTLPTVAVGFECTRPKRRGKLKNIWGLTGKSRRKSAQAMCKHDEHSWCQAHTLERTSGFTHQVGKFRQYWSTLSQAERRNVMLRELRNSRGPPQTLRSPRHQSIRFSFLNFPVCRKSFRAITGINPWRAVKDYHADKIRFEAKSRPRPSVIADEVHSALKIIIRHFSMTSPYTHSHGKDVVEGEVLLPFHDRICLLKMLEQWWYEQQRCKTEVPLETSVTTAPSGTSASASLLVLQLPLSRKPTLSIFKKVLSRTEFQLVKFHRHVTLERCPKCCLFRYKLLSCQEEEREHWRRLLAAHHFLQISQKRRYAEDRAWAAADFAKRELYMALDGGSGFDFVLPHLSPKDAELPSKALKDVHTLPLKVMNSLVHGDHRSHVILSAGSIVAGANHLCESIAITLNAAFEDHGDLPDTISCNLDNASVNHNMLTLAFAGLYVLFGVTRKFRIRFELENHAHDIYDAFQGIHGQAVRRVTYYHLEELIGIIKQAHQVRKSPADRPLMGHSVMVTNLWNVRDFWQWLSPGRQSDDNNKSRAAYVTYTNIQQYRDFTIQLETTENSGTAVKGPADISVGLWAKQYMSDPDSKLQYVGTLTTRKMYDAVVGDTVPQMAALTSRPKKVSKEEVVLEKARKLSTCLLYTSPSPRD